MIRLGHVLMGALLALFVAQLSAEAQTLEETRAKVNGYAVGIMGGSLGGTDMSLRPIWDWPSPTDTSFASCRWSALAP